MRHSVNSAHGESAAARLFGGVLLATAVAWPLACGSAEPAGAGGAGGSSTVVASSTSAASGSTTSGTSTTGGESTTSSSSSSSSASTGSGFPGVITPAPLSALVAGANRTCLVSDQGKLRCWGDNYEYQCGYASGAPVGDDPGEMPPADVAAAPDGDRVILVAPGWTVTCVVTDRKEVRCFGTGYHGEHGTGELGTILGDEAKELPSAPVNLGGEVDQVSVGASHACALMVGGAVRCWGSNDLGELGNGSIVPRGADPTDFPPPDVPLPGPMVRVHAGVGSTCALAPDGSVYCWGYNGAGQLGVGTTESVGDEPGEMPPKASGFGAPIVSLAMASNHVCGVLADGHVRCFGEGSTYQLANGKKDSIGDAPAEIPPQDSGFGADIVDIAAADATTCVLTSSGFVRCAGSNIDGRCAAGPTETYVGDVAAELPPTDVALGASAVALTAGTSHFCALLSDGAVRCWGLGGNGQLGNGSMNNIGDDETPASQPALTVYP